MPTLILTVDLQCCRCSSKIQKILCCIQDRGEFVIEKIVYEKDKVLVSGPFDAEKLSCKLWCKACKIIKNIEVAKPPPEKKKDEKKPEEKKPEPKPAPCQLVPYPYPYPYPYPQYPSTCPPCGCPAPYCECHSKQPTCGCPEPPKPPKEPEKPKEKQKPKEEPPKPPTCGPCGCPTWPSCHCFSCPPYQPRPMPCPPLFVCEESQPYGACAIM